MHFMNVFFLMTVEVCQFYQRVWNIKWPLSWATGNLFVLVSNTPNFCQLKIIGVTFIHEYYVYIIPNIQLFLLSPTYQTQDFFNYSWIYTHVIYTHKGVCMHVRVCVHMQPDQLLLMYITQGWALGLDGLSGDISL